MSKRSVRTPPRAGADLIFFGGKGGVGKTTCASAFGAEQAAGGARVLLVSTDPAHSLGDALGLRLSARPTAIAMPGRRRPAGGGAHPSLHAIELDARQSFRRWLRARRQGLIAAVEHGSWLDRSDAEALLALPFPGVDELAGVLEIARLTRLPYDLVVVDTAPTGHTLRMFEAPATVGAVAAALDAMQQRHRTIRARFGAGRAELSDRVIAQLAHEAQTAADLLHDARSTSFQWVMLPEVLSLRETADGIAALHANALNVTTIVINRALPSGSPCELCDARRRAEARVIRAVEAQWGRALRLVVVADTGREPRGVRELGAIRRQPADRWHAGRAERIAGRRGPVSGRPTGGPPSAWFEAAVDRARLIFVAGKGGVGKTTVAAACALRLARHEPRARVLLLSTDPAHSLGDVFDAPAGETPSHPRGAPRNLHIRELDAAAAMAARRAALLSAVDEMAGGLGPAEARASVGRLLDLAPPGVDEVFGLVSVAELLRAAYDRVVIDMAPTGHALRLLELPDAAADWVHTLMRMLLKYREVRSPGRLGAELVNAARQLREVRELLRDPARARCLVVSRAAGVPLAETERLLARLRRLRMRVPAVVANAVVPPSAACPRCGATQAAERRQLALLRAACRRQRANPCAIIQAPMVAPPPRGIAALERWSRTWMR